MTTPTETTSEQQSLFDALAAEHSAVFAYGLIAAFANPTRSAEVAAAAAAHRARRDAVIDTFTSSGVTAPLAEAGYTIPFPVVDPISSAQLAAQVEADTAIAWRAVVEHSEIEDTRILGVQALTDAAIRAAAWRAALGVEPPTTAFPGQP